LWLKASPGKQFPISEETPSQKRAGGVAQDVGCEIKPQYHKKKKKKKKNTFFLIDNLSVLVIIFEDFRPEVW
jgi:hypothetical protein